MGAKLAKLGIKIFPTRFEAKPHFSAKNADFGAERTAEILLHSDNVPISPTYHLRLGPFRAMTTLITSGSFRRASDANCIAVQSCASYADLCGPNLYKFGGD